MRVKPFGNFLKSSDSKYTPNSLSLLGVYEYFFRFSLSSVEQNSSFKIFSKQFLLRLAFSTITATIAISNKKIKIS
jgi:hypothetical protein